MKRTYKRVGGGLAFLAKNVHPQSYLRSVPRVQPEVVTISFTQPFGPTLQRKSYLDVGLWRVQARTLCCSEARPPGELGQSGDLERADAPNSEHHYHRPEEKSSSCLT